MEFATAFLEQAIRLLLSETGVVGALLVVFMVIAWRLDSRIQELNEKIQKASEIRHADSERFRDQVIAIKDEEMERQIKQVEMYTNMQNAIEKFGALLERIYVSGRS